ncbi:MAG: rhomboid family intramembrane serine protease [Salana multivorans]|nr:rhomboid family intramembrane serine protease [Salana multivorans]OJX96871.1 MAG: hypothetical protein BGO96_01955 [Micrococcales bacterium 73-15]
MSYLPSQGAEAPTCPRHPDRVAYTRCQRCDRPACPECQRPASVGFHCVDCARGAASARPVVRTVFGGVSRGSTPVVTMTIMAICIALEALRWIAAGVYQRIAVQLVFVPQLGLVEPYRFLTSTLLHSGIWHLAFNMYALWLIGQQLELLLGRARFLTLYCLSAIGGSVAYLAIAGVGAGGVVGASGGVFGLFGAFAVFMRRLGRDPKPILVIIGINVVLGFVISNIAWQAHLGGLVVGALVALVFARVPVRRGGAARGPAVLGPSGPRPGVAGGLSGATLQWLLCGAITLVLVAIVWLVYALA